MQLYRHLCFFAKVGASKEIESNLFDVKLRGLGNNIIHCPGALQCLWIVQL